MIEILAPPLTDEQVERLADALAHWAENHPHPEKPILGFAYETALSPRQLAEEVRKRSEISKPFIRMVRCGVEVESFERILEGFYRRRARG